MSSHFVFHTYPETIKKEFEEYGYLEIDVDYVIKYIRVWDLELFLFLSNPNNEGITYTFLTDGINGNREKVSNEFIHDCLFTFYKGYKIGLVEYEKELNHRINPLSKSDENIKKYTLELEKDFRYWIDHSFWSYPLTETDFHKIGRDHGLYTTIRNVVEKHGWDILQPEILNSSSEVGEFEKLIDVEKIKTFQDLRNEYLKHGHKETLKSLAGLLQALIEKRFFHLNLKPELRNGRSTIRKAFEKQFNIELSEQFKPKDIDTAEVKIWLERINSL